MESVQDKCNVMIKIVYGRASVALAGPEIPVGNGMDGWKGRQRVARSESAFYYYLHLAMCNYMAKKNMA